MTDTPSSGAADAARAARTPVHESTILVLQALQPLAPWATLIACLVARGLGVPGDLCLLIGGGALAVVDPRRVTNGVRP